MSQGPFTERISATLDLLDELAARHEETRAYEVARERMAYVHDRLRQLQMSLRALRMAAALMRAGLDDPTGDDLWHTTCADLRSRAPETLHSPGRALITANLDLLRLVEYTGAAISLTEERRDRLVDRLAQHLAAAGSSDLSQPAAGLARTQIRVAIEQFAQSDQPWTAEALARLWECFGPEHEAGR